MEQSVTQQRILRTFHFFDGDPVTVSLDTETNERLNVDWSTAGGKRPSIGSATQSLGVEPSAGCFTYSYWEPSWKRTDDDEPHMLSVRLSDVRFIS